eukprot:6481123-Amphidinium_carterae.1
MAQGPKGAQLVQSLSVRNHTSRGYLDSRPLQTGQRLEQVVQTSLLLEDAAAEIELGEGHQSRKNEFPKYESGFLFEDKPVDGDSGPPTKQWHGHLKQIEVG